MDRPPVGAGNLADMRPTPPQSASAPGDPDGGPERVHCSRRRREGGVLQERPETGASHQGVPRWRIAGRRV